MSTIALDAMVVAFHGLEVLGALVALVLHVKLVCIAIIVLPTTVTMVPMDAVLLMAVLLMAVLLMAVLDVHPRPVVVVRNRPMVPSYECPSAPQLG